jgi:hypothetical protein
MAIIDNHCEETDVSVGFHPSYTNTQNLQMWCNAIAVDGNTYSNGGKLQYDWLPTKDDKCAKQLEAGPRTVMARTVQAQTAQARLAKTRGMQSVCAAQRLPPGAMERLSERGVSRGSAPPKVS